MALRKPISDGGYKENFLGQNFKIKLPVLNDDQKQDLVKFDGGKFKLDFIHYSAVMSKSRRLAFFTAVNIDGNLWKDNNRKGDFQDDPRIQNTEQLGRKLYSAAKSDFDRGHLVRREDPEWGTVAESKRAGENTFWFTNCAPQHKDLNQKIWGELEANILHLGADDQNLKINVLNDATSTISHDETLTVKNARTRIVKEGDETVTLEKGKRTVTIQTGSDTLDVKDTRTVKVGSNQIHSTGGNYTHEVTGNYELTVDGNLTIKVSGTLTLQSNGDFTARSDANLTNQASMSLANKAGTGLINEAGTSLENKAGTTLTNDAAISLTSKAGATQTIDGGGMLVLKGGIIKAN